jgi:predicted component of type VI protein secretion system
MTWVTLQLIDGPERGQIFSDLPTPVTIGRVADNAVQLNDQRASRFHAKIQEDSGRLILTDLDSTNGTQVNGQPVQARVMQPGDQLLIGRCLLIFGSSQEIAAYDVQRGDNGHPLSDPEDPTVTSKAGLLDGDVVLGQAQELRLSDPAGFDEPFQDQLFSADPPEPPQRLHLFQRAEISDFLAYSHEQIRAILLSAVEVPKNEGAGIELMGIGWRAWQRLLKLEMDLAVYIKNIAEPKEQAG